jgi:ankyrin repeat protein
MHEGVDVNMRNAQGITAVFSAIPEGHIGVVRLLIMNGADVSATDSAGRTALEYALMWNQADIVDLLIRSGADVDTDRSGAPGRTLLLDEARALDGSMGMARRLIEAGADIHVEDPVTGHTVLHYAARAGAMDVIEMLLSRDADVNARSHTGTTPLQLAAGGGHNQAARLLLRAGAKWHEADEDGHVPLHAAAASGHEATVHLLLEGGLISTQALTPARPLYPLPLKKVMRRQWSCSCAMERGLNRWVQKERSIYSYLPGGMDIHYSPIASAPSLTATPTSIFLMWMATQRCTMLWNAAMRIWSHF